MTLARFKLLNTTLLLILSFGCVSFEAASFDSISMKSAFIAGKDYEITSPEQESEPLVEEFFNYACPHCYTLEKFVSDFKDKNPDIRIKYVPVELKPAWKIYVKAYYIGEKLGVLDKSHKQLFHRINVEHQYFNNDADMKDFFISIGVDEKSYDEVANSYWLDKNIRLAKQYAKKNNVMSTPALLVNKRYKLNNAAIGSYGKLSQAIIELSVSQE